MHVELHDTPEQLAEPARAEPRGKVARRLIAVRLAMLGRTAARVAAEVLPSDRQARTWVARSNAEGAAGLADRPGRGRKGPLKPEQEERLKARLAAGPTAADGTCKLRGEEVRRILRQEFGVVCSLQAVYDLLRRLGLRASAAPATPPEGRRRRADGLQKSIPDRVAPVAADHLGEHVEVWFEEEARFGREGTLTTVWVERNTRPAAPKQTACGNLYPLGAVCPATGQAERLIAPRPKAGVVQLSLESLAATIPRGTHAALVWDGAGYHIAGALQVPSNLALVGLPPYSPELNPVERLWLYLRQHHWSNRVHPTIEDIEEAAVAGWRAVCLDPGTIRSICRCDYVPDGN